MLNIKVLIFEYASKQNILVILTENGFRENVRLSSADKQHEYYSRELFSFFNKSKKLILSSCRVQWLVK